MMTIATISAMSLFKPSSKIKREQDVRSTVAVKKAEVTHSGCKLTIPNFCARAPVMKGKSAEPANPKLAIQPIEPVSSQGGMRRPVSFIRIGYMGPRTNPTKETATASPMRLRGICAHRCASPVCP